MKLLDYSPTEQRMVIKVLKHGIIFRELLGNFESGFIDGYVTKYARYGRSISIRGKQIDVFKQIAYKLDIQ